jgi:hypothetical protein
VGFRWKRDQLEHESIRDAACGESSPRWLSVIRCTGSRVDKWRRARLGLVRDDVHAPPVVFDVGPSGEGFFQPAKPPWPVQGGPSPVRVSEQPLVCRCA